jgi:hypothetical protein
MFEKPGATGVRVADVTRGRRIVVICDDEPVEAFEGETIATALLAAGRRTLGRSARLGRPRGLFCGMGVCFECAMTIDGSVGIRACLTDARHGMVLRSKDRGRER